MARTKEEVLRQLPAVGTLLNETRAQDLSSQYPRGLVVEAIRRVLEEVRQEILRANASDEQAELPDIAPSALLERANAVLTRQILGQMPRIINATGIVVHTGLGRSLLSERAIARMIEIARSHCALEVDIETGERGSRDTRIAQLLCQLTGAQAATIVNNNAAAVLLTLNTLAEGKEVIVSVGEMVEIGGSFRIPDVMRRSGAKLVAVGTTNKTRLKDYELAITDNTALLLKVHRSNFAIVGFTEEVRLEALVELGRKHGLPVMEDLGSGALVDLSQLSQFGIQKEPLVQESIASGADVVTFSGDKLLGGPQAGLIAGREEFVQRIRNNPLYRAVRCDKLTIAGMEATLLSYFDEQQALTEIPTLRAICEPEERVRARAVRLSRRLRRSGVMNVSVRPVGKGLSKELGSQVGGGALPTEFLPTWLVCVRPVSLSAEHAARRLRMGTPCVFCRLQQDELWFDVRTVRDEEVKELAEAIQAATALE